MLRCFSPAREARALDYVCVPPTVSCSLGAFKACMSKAGKFVTSINKLKRLYERDLVERGLVNDKRVA